MIESTQIAHIDAFTLETVSKGINRSAVSMSSLLNHDVKVVSVNVTENLERVAQSFRDSITEDSVLLLKTELVGPVAGINYVVLTKSDVTTICNNVFGPELADENSPQFVIEFLKEIENVLAASAITEIADTLQLDMYGDVPKIQATSLSRIHEVIFNETQSLYPKVLIGSDFHIPSLKISPKVFWFFGEAFKNVDLA